MRFLGPHSAGEGPHLVPISLKFGSPSGPHFEKSGSPGLVGTVLQNLLDDFKIYWTTSEFTGRLQIFTERLGFWKLKFRVLLDPAEVY